MLYVQYVVPDLEYSSAATQIALLAPGLARAGWPAELCAPAGDGPAVRASGVPVTAGPARSPGRWLALRRRLPRPGRGIAHVFGLPALHQFWLATLGTRRPPVVLSLAGRERLTRWDRRCLRVVNTVLVHHQPAADALMAQGIPADRVRRVPLAVGEPPPAPDRAALLGSVGIPPDASVVVTVGRMPDRHRLFQAVWAFEFIRYTDPNAWLLIVGDGPGRAGMEAGAQGLAPEGPRTRFLGDRLDAAAVVGLADVALAPHQWGGANAALEAMAAGRAVVAVNTPDLAALIDDGRTGRLAPARDAVGLASVVRKLLLDPAERQRLGSAAQAQVRDRHQAGTVVQALETIYREEFTSARAGLW